MNDASGKLDDLLFKIADVLVLARGAESSLLNAHHFHVVQLEKYRAIECRIAQ